MSKGLEKLQENNVLYHKYTIHQVYGETLKADNVEKQINENNNVIEKELTNYAEIKEIAKHYHWDDLVSDVFGVETDRKWQLKFNAAICDVQEDYKKARALEVIIAKNVDVVYLRWECNCLEDYNDNQSFELEEKDKLTEEEFDLLKGVYSNV